MPDPVVDPEPKQEPKPEPKPEPKGFSQEDVNRFLAKERKRHEAELAERPTKEQFEELDVKFRQLSESAELKGKSEIEKIEIKHQRDLDKLTHKFDAMAAESKAKDEKVAKAENTLRTERMRRSFGAALAKADVYGGGSDDALEILISKVTEVEFDDNGAIRASYGDLLDDSPEAIAKQFLEDRPHFASAKAGGAGTKQPTGKPQPAGNLQEMNLDEVWTAAGDEPSGPQPH